MNKYRKKIKHLRATFLQFAKDRSIPGHWPEFLEEDYDFIEDLEIRSNITPLQMRHCNKLYRKYRNV